jgi:hypothetical protein
MNVKIEKVVTFSSDDVVEILAREAGMEGELYLAHFEFDGTEISIHDVSEVRLRSTTESNNKLSNKLSRQKWLKKRHGLELSD